MLEITGDDILKLSDGDLRALIALLCEAELRRRRVSVSGVTWGGDQDAPDGGLDVRVNMPKRKTAQGFIPRHVTGFQVKKSDMTPNAIVKEMRPRGKVRAVISELAKRSGAYVIVASKGSVSDSALRNRRQAMLKGAKGIKNARALCVDFYDRNRLATWVRDHPGLIPWVRARVGRPLQGWRSFGPWANSAEDTRSPYLLDSELRIHTGKREKDNGLNAVDGLNRIREILSEPRKVVRIVGLSGVGKSHLAVAKDVRATLAHQFRGLWTLPSLRTELDRICQLIGRNEFWREGWIAVCQTLQYDGKGMKNAAKKRLKALEENLRPKHLVQNVRAIVLSKGLHGLDLDDFDEDEDVGGTIDRPDRIAIALGKDVAHDEAVLAELAPELTSGEGRLWLFGQGLASATQNPTKVWRLLAAQFCATQALHRNAHVLRGFLHGLSEKDMKLADTFLDAALSHQVLAEWFPELQVAVPIGAHGIKRLCESLAIGKAPIWQYRYLSFGRVSDPIPGPGLTALLNEMSSKDGGLDVAIEILYMRLFSDSNQKRLIDPTLVEAGRSLLKRFTFTKDAKDDHRIGCLIEKCLSGADGADCAKEICGRLLAAIAARETYGLGYGNLLQELFKVQPTATLDGFFDGSKDDQRRACQLMLDVSHRHQNPIDIVPSATILVWCDKKPAERYVLMAKMVGVFAGKSGRNRQVETESPALSWSETDSSAAR